ncbi:transporter substrate-binding domain-containing protein [Burkholderia sp. AW49-1]
MTTSRRAFLTPLQRLIPIIPSVQITLEAKAWIAAHPVVRTYGDTHWRPLEFRERGKVVGVVPSYPDAIWRISGLRFEYVENVSWPGSYHAFMSRKIDMAPDAITVTGKSRRPVPSCSP